MPFCDKRLVSLLKLNITNMAKKKRKSVNELLECKEFHYYLLKKLERLTIILNYNMSRDLDPNEEDIAFLEEELVAYDNSSMKWAEEKPELCEDVIQSEIYSDSVADKVDK